jgi:hypothetical protein
VVWNSRRLSKFIPGEKGMRCSTQLLAMMNYETKSKDSLKSLMNCNQAGKRTFTVSAGACAAR